MVQSECSVLLEKMGQGEAKQGSVRNRRVQALSPPSAITVMIVLLLSQPAYAYLDPGSGSAIISVITATIGALWFSLKSLIYRFSSGQPEREIARAQENSLVILSEGRAYWGTFRPLVEELIKEKIHFRYRTLDLYDPALMVESEYMHAKRLSLNPFALSELNRIKAPIMLSTTPNIGADSFPIARPQNVGNLMHVFHHVGDISIYKKHSLDHYDSVILAGDFQKDAIRKLEKLRGLKPKVLTTIGLPYLDDLCQKRRPPTPKDGRPTILVGSSWGKKGCLQTYGTDFIVALVDAGFHVIVRPHPQSYISEPDFIAQCKRELGDSVQWDDEVSPLGAMQASQLLISDTSSLRFDYAFLYERPIITLDIPKGNLTEFEADVLDETWYDSATSQIGVVVNFDTINDICNIVRDVVETHPARDLRAFRQRAVANFGNSAPFIVEHINAQLSSGEPGQRE